jgi:hypothetical protein
MLLCEETPFVRCLPIEVCTGACSYEHYFYAQRIRFAPCSSTAHLVSGSSKTVTSLFLATSQPETAMQLRSLRS